VIYGKLTKHECYNLEQDRVTRPFIQILEKYAKKTDSILEVGASFGRSLDMLKDDGYKNLTALEPDEIAFEEIKHKKYLGTLDDLEKLKPFDVIFTKSVLYLIEEPNYQLLVDKTNKYLILYEGEILQKECRWWLHNRNYKDIFEGLGMKQVFECDSFFALIRTPDGQHINGTKLRVFKK
jgi:hypothetical protein